MAALYDDASFAKKANYQLDKLQFGRARTAFDTLTSVAFLYYAFYPASWALAGRVLAACGYPAATEIAQSVVWVILLTLISTAMSLPWSAFR